MTLHQATAERRLAAQAANVHYYTEKATRTPGHQCVQDKLTAIRATTDLLMVDQAWDDVDQLVQLCHELVIRCRQRCEERVAAQPPLKEWTGWKETQQSGLGISEDTHTNGELITKE